MTNQHKTPLTVSEEKAFDYIVVYSSANGHLPTIHVMAQHFKYTPAHAARIVRALVSKGWLKLRRVNHRAIEL